MSLSPKKAPNKPPLSGTESAKVVNASPAVAEAVIASGSTLPPLTSAEYPAKAVPKSTKPSEKVSKSFSPKNFPSIPPLFGTLSANLVNAWPAVADAWTEATSTLPLTTAE